MARLRTGDRVSWAISQVRPRGEIIDEKTTDFEFTEQTFRASPGEPAFKSPR